MAKHAHKHSGEESHEHKSAKRPPHKDWRAWLVVILMLAAMAAYIWSLDESLEPGGDTEQPPVPAAP